MRAQLTKNAVIVPGGRQGRLLPQAAADDPSELRDEVERQYVAYIARAARRHRQPRRRRGRAPEGVRVLDERRHLPRRRRRQGHGDVLGHRQPRRRGATASGSATRSPPAARRATTTRRSGSRRAARGSRSSATSASSASTPQTDAFTVVGIGDMSGDVFGNGMLLSRQHPARRRLRPPARLHRPGPGRRRRASRSASGCSTSPARRGTTTTARADLRGRRRVAAHRQVRSRCPTQAREALGVEDDGAARPTTSSARSCARRSTCSGTAASAPSSRRSTETDADAPGPLRATRSASTRASCAAASWARAATSGCTRRARVEFARGGGRINADFIDNSAGVDCSDHEVNLKILLGLAERRGELTRPERDELLREVTDDVVEHVLYDSFLQAQIIAQEVERSADAAVRLRGPDGRARGGRSARPRARGPAHRRGAGRAPARGPRAWSGRSWRCCSPTPSALKRALLESSLLDDPWLERDLRGYFPPPVVERFGAAARRASAAARAARHDQRQPRRQRARADVRLPDGGRARRATPPRSCGRTGSPARSIGAEARWEAIEELEGQVDPASQRS